MDKIKSFLARTIFMSFLAMIIIRPFYPALNYGGYFDNAIFIFEILIWLLVLVEVVIAIGFSFILPNGERKSEQIEQVKKFLEGDERNIILKYSTRTILLISIVVSGIVVGDISMTLGLISYYVMYRIACKKAKYFLEECLIDSKTKGEKC